MVRQSQLVSYGHVGLRATVGNSRQAAGKRLLVVLGSQMNCTGYGCQRALRSRVGVTRLQGRALCCSVRSELQRPGQA